MNIFWFRRDLRIEDNAGLFHALQNGKTLGIFIFDTDILHHLDNESDKRVNIITQELVKINSVFRKHNSSIKQYIGKPIEVWKEITNTFKISGVYFNKDYEPYGIKRDNEVVDLLNSKGISHYKYLDHLIFKPNGVLKMDNSPYSVFTPYSKKWKEKLLTYSIPEYPSENLLFNLESCLNELIPIEKIGFKETPVKLASIELNNSFLTNYAQNRNIPSLEHTSHLSVYLRFGLKSIRQIVAKVKHEESFLNELIWREFYMQILYHFPHTISKSFKPQYDSIIWSHDMNLFSQWCEGRTGFPMVDAGMRELNATGLMHNRVRMICSSFLVKNLWIDWRLGEAYFASKLLDFELSSNVGGWQWAASCGCDAVPYFRIFNPTLQQEKFDKDFRYIKFWLPEFGTSSYPMPIIDFKDSRDKAIANYKKYLTHSN